MRLIVCVSALASTVLVGCAVQQRTPATALAPQIDRSSGGLSQPKASNWRDCPAPLFSKEVVIKALEACVSASGIIATNHIRLRLGDSPSQLQEASSPPV